MVNFNNKVMNFLKNEFNVGRNDVCNLSEDEWENIRDECFMIESNYENEPDERLYCAGVIVSTSYKTLHE